MKHFLLNSRLLLAGLAALPAVAHAQTADRPTSIGLHASALQYRGTFGNSYWDFDRNNYTAGFGINQYLSRGLDLNGQIFYGDLKGTRGPNATFSTTLVNVNVGFKLKLNNGWALKENAFFQPYLLAAPGWTYASRSGFTDGKPDDQIENHLDLFAGAGINFRLGGVVGLFVQTGQHLPLNANFDGTTVRDADRLDDRFLQHTVGLTFSLGQGPDQDLDEVPDRRDRCPNTPPGTPVNENGCPLDDDRDGVPNYQDQCPTEAGVAELQGCPDGDGDGVTDTDDRCPDTPGKAEYQGCPDSDRDGVGDVQDQCPDTPMGTPVDSVGCPAVTSPATTSAATDRDGDGVADADDRCPTSAGPATNRGCPEVKAEARQQLQEATQFIAFELNKAALLPASYATLDGIAQLLTEYPDYTLSIAGHTDSKGSAAFNLRLARERAAAAASYLRGKGVPETRVVLRGYGPTHPIADNATDAGRARNRRVEFDLFLTGDPNPAEVKYGPEPPVPAVKAPAKAAPVKKAAGKKATARKAPAKATPKAASKKAVRKPAAAAKPAVAKPAPRKPAPAKPAPKRR
ncbi:OmpA family protein [Hymenobacter busanensis]|uniref:OmpA family protein n=1 Tax=Hymenobacter busanensis TaxID=2607656 RepID=A0A7L4ZZQ4_9BACT|nr:OmpA family protein [Hymenobacter busanensis]KAA9332040.1 OmpA family protein [Hymenobacter busanensis]QHJ07622.1 OmpA family protein [Hymenobacter busanensis]